MTRKQERKQAAEMTSCDTENNFTNDKMSVDGSSQIKPCHVFGVSKGVRNNILFQDEETVIFPSGKLCVSYNIPEQHPEFIHGAEGSKGMRALAISPDRRYLAVSECGKWGSITIIDLKNHSKEKVLKGKDYGVQEFVCMAFSADSEYLLGQAGGPSWTLYCWQWKKNKLVAAVQIKTRGDISQVSFNPQDDTKVCVTGKGVFRIYEFKNGALGMMDSYNVEKMNVLCHTWMSSNSIIAGTEEGLLLNLKSKHRLVKCLMGKACERQKDSSSSPTPVTAITAIVPYSDGFAFSTGLGVVSLYEKVQTKDNYSKTVTLRIPVDPCSNKPLQAITSMCISPSEQTLAISTDQGQLYHISLDSEELIKNEKPQFTYLSQSFHSGSITGLAICVAKPIMATCSKDCTIHIWNYHKKTLELFKEFDEEPRCVSMHPDSHSILVGFSTEVCLMDRFVDNLCTVRTFPINNCTECVFNHDGSRFAAISENMIHIFNIKTQKRLDLSGHHKQVQSLKWSKDDCRLVSCGTDGTVFVWDALTGNAAIRSEATSLYTDVTFAPNTGSVLAVGRRHLREISDEGVLYEMASDGVAYTAVSMTRSGVFVGTSAGTVRVLDYPFDKEMTWTEHQAHAGPITKMVVTPGDQYLLTASKDGSIFIWSIIDQNGQTLEKVVELDYFEEVYCKKEFLDEKDKLINDLTLKVQQLEMEQDIEMNRIDLEHDEKINTVVQSYQKQTEELKEELQTLIAVTEAEMISYEKALTKQKENFAKEMKDMVHRFHEEHSVEFENDEEQKMQLVQKHYEYELQKAEENYQCEMEQTIQACEAEVQELEAVLEQNRKTFNEEQQRILQDAAYEALELSKEYEKDIQEEKELTQRIEQELQDMEKKISTYWTMKSITEDQLTNISDLREGIKNQRNQVFEAEHNLMCLTKEMEEQSQIISDQDRTIEELNKRITDLELKIEERKEELHRITLEKGKKVAEDEMQESRQKMEIEQLKKTIQEDKDMFSKIAAEMEQDERKDQEIIFDLKKKIKVKKKGLEIERQKTKSANILLERMKYDLHKCSHYIQDPKKLKENLIKLHRRYIYEADVTISPADEITRYYHRQIDHFEKVQKTQKETHTRNMKLENNRASRIERESYFLTERLMDERLKHLHLLNDYKEENIQSAVTPKRQYKPVIKPQCPAHQRGLLEKRRGQTFALEKEGQFAPQKLTSSVKLPPIHPR